MTKKVSEDNQTASAFANSWNNLPIGSVYTEEQFVDWLKPLTKEDIINKRVLELGCGNGSLLSHMIQWGPDYLEGVDLGESVMSAKRNLSMLKYDRYKIIKADLVNYESEGFDVVYCIGVLHHLKNPKNGLDSVIRNTLPGGKFHCWVYGEEGNSLIIHLVDPIRKIASRIHWRITKYFIATLLVIPYYFYSKILFILPRLPVLKKLPLHDYSLWIAKRNFLFYQHVAFDQLVTPQTQYFSKRTISDWLNSYPQIEKESVYIIQRNGNSWKFGGTTRKL